MKKSAIARGLGLDRKTVAVNLQKTQSPEYTRTKQRISKLDAYKEYLNARLKEYDLTAHKLHQEIQKQGYAGGYGIVAGYVKTVKKEFSRSAVLRFETLPGQQAQVDWGYFGTLYDQMKKKMVKLYCFFMILGYSRALYIEFFPKADLYHFLKGHNNAFRYFGGYPKEFLYDNLKSVVIKRALRAQDSVFNKKFMDFAGYYGFQPILCRPYKPNTKGKVENSVLFAKQNFFAGEEFHSLDEVNLRAQGWLGQINQRIHATTHQKPWDRLQREDLFRMEGKPFYDMSLVCYRRVLRDSHICYDGNYYSVPFVYAGREIMTRQTPEGMLIIQYRDQIIAQHTLAHEQKGHYLTKPAHLEGLKAVRMQSRLGRPRRKRVSLDRSVLSLMRRPSALGAIEVASRELSDYQEAI